MSRLLRGVLVTGFLCLGLACSSAEQTGNGQQSATTEEQFPQGGTAVEQAIPAIEETIEEEYDSYDGVGVIQAVFPEEGRVTIDHEEIPRFMRAMTMSFLVEDPALLEGIEVGESVTFHLEKRGRYFKITRLEQSE